MQQDPFVLLRKISGKFDAMEIDALDNIYVLFNNRLKKIRINGDSVAVFNDVKQYGNPYKIDVSNPLKTLVYYKNYSTVVILDRFLTQRNAINLRQKNIFKVKAITTSYDNNIRLFDEQDFKLKKIDDDGTVISETNDFRLIFDTVPSPVFISEKDNSIFLYDPKAGFYVFDYYGSLKNRLPFRYWEHPAVYKDHLTGISEGKLYSYELNTLNLKTWPLPAYVKDYVDIKAVNGRLYLLRKDGIEIFDLR